MKENKAEASHMQRQIWENLNDCSLHHQNIRVTRQKLWRKYYKYVPSDEFADMWSQFLMKSIGFEACPLFYQFVTKLIMNNIIEKEFPIKSTDQLSSMSTIQYEDMNVNRYNSGYVLRSVLKKVSKSAQPFKDYYLVACTCNKQSFFSIYLVISMYINTQKVPQTLVLTALKFS
jgi:hypothetical protein